MSASGDPGGSARRMAERLKGELESISSTRSPPVRMIRMLFPSDQERRLERDVRNWRTGAEGEQQLAVVLAKRCRGVSVLHDRRVPGSGGNIDHIGIAATGVYVIDCKRYSGRIRVERRWLSREPRLLIDSSDRTSLIDGLNRQVIQVRRVLESASSPVPVYGCLCFVAPQGIFRGVGLPLFGTSEINGYKLYDAKRLAKRLNEDGRLTRDRRRELSIKLAAQFPPAR